MPTSAHSPAGGTEPTRILIIDDHEISRAACRALLRTEGLDVVADVAAGDQAVTAARALRPDVVIIDVTPAASAGFGIAGRLHALPVPPTVILTSSTDRAQFGARLNGHRFIPKADVSAAAIARLAASPETGGSESPNPGTAPRCPS
jgi:DNA-binding NarL/FixJ family response regulator